MGQTRTGKNSGARNGRVMMHLDMDAFFVNVELLENPALRGEPIIVAPLGPRSVVCSASYEAKPQPQCHRPAVTWRLPALLPCRHGNPERSEPLR